MNHGESEDSESNVDASAWARAESFFHKDSLARVLLQALLIVVIGGVGGNLVGHFLSNLSEVKNRRLDENERKLEFVEEFTKAAHRRLYLMKLVVWELTLHNEVAPFRQDLLRRKYEDYYNTLTSWNELFHYHLITLDRYFPQNQDYVEKCVISVGPTLDCNSSVRSLAIDALQGGYGRVHRILKPAVDNRLQYELCMPDGDIARLDAEIAKLNEVVNDYGNLLFKLLNEEEGNVPNVKRMGGRRSRK